MDWSDPDVRARSLRIGLAAVAALVVAAAVLLLVARNDDDGQSVKTASGTSTSSSSTSSSSSTTLEETTTSTETTVAPATTAAAAPPTTAKPTTTARPTTTATTFPPGTARVTIVNNHPKTLEVILNSKTTVVPPNSRTGPIAIPPEVSEGQNGNDVVNLHVQDDPGCGTGGADSYFEPDRAYTFTVDTQTGVCGERGPNLRFRVEPA